MMKRLICYAIVIFMLSCNSNEFTVTGEYAYNPNGFPNGLTFALLKVDSFYSDGRPKNSKDSIRVDLYHFAGKVKKRIYFFQPNEGYYWEAFLAGNKSETLPIRFEKNNWYAVWDGNFEKGLFKTEKHSFFLYCDSLGKIRVQEHIFHTNL